jgi:3-oxoadipate enol-lactonase
VDPVAHVTPYSEVAGTGPTVVFVHQGIADSRVWDPQWASFDGYRRVRLDLRGYGRSPVGTLPLSHARDVAELLDELGVHGAALVGGSVGGRVALEVALARPELVAALVLVCSGLPDHDWSATVKTYAHAEDDAVVRGDLDAATELNLRMWVDGPRRTADDVDPGGREAVREMQRRALELQAPVWADLDEDLLVPDVGERLSQVRVPTLVLVGDEDVDDIHTIAARLADGIPDARRATLAGAAHVPNLERPAEFDAIVLGFLEEALAG